MKELRKHPRFECEGVAEIHLLGIEKSCPARIEDLSLKGCKLVLLDEPEPEPESESEFDLPNVFEVTFTVNELSFRVRGRLAGFRAARCIGVEFLDLRPRSKRYILDMVEELAAGGWKPSLQGAASNQLGARVLVMSREK
jgi:c-di-GMP-binding flagellar brake protein YcgR